MTRSPAARARRSTAGIPNGRGPEIRNRYAVIGGAGAMGRIAVRDLLEFSEPGDEVLIADFDLAQARALAESLPARPGRIAVTRVDVRDRPGALRALAGSQVLINAAQYALNLEVMELALALRAHYVDLGGLFHMTQRQLRLDRRFRDAGRLALLGMGAAPGITNLLARMGAESFDQVEELHLRVAGVDQTRYASKPALAVSYSLQTILEELSLEPAVFRRGRLEFVAPMSGELPHRFPNPVGLQRPLYTLHSEVATLPDSYAHQGVREVSFKIAFEPEFLQRVRFLRDLGLASHEPVRVGGSEVRPIELVNRIAMSQQRAVPIGRVRQHEVVRAVVKGREDGRPVTRVLDLHTRGMPRWNVGIDVDTGAPPAIAARMLVRGEIASVGALPPERAVPPGPFFAQLARRGMRVNQLRKAGWDFSV